MVGLTLIGCQNSEIDDALCEAQGRDGEGEWARRDYPSGIAMAQWREETGRLGGCWAGAGAEDAGGKRGIQGQHAAYERENPGARNTSSG
jgi:hypothetical protein